MDAKPAASLKTVRLLTIVCVAVALSGLTWSAWDMFGPSRRPMLQGWDDSFYYFWLPSVVIDHDLDFSNQLAQGGTVDPAMRDLALTLPHTKTGLLATKYPPGWALASLPFFLAAHAVAPSGATGFEPVYLIAVWLGQLLYAVGGVWLAIKIIGRYFPRNIATIAVLVGWLASPLVYYQTARLSMSHSQVFAAAMAVFWLALRISDGSARVRHWALLGFCSALLVVTRNVTVVYLVLPALVAAKKLRSVKSAASLALGATIPITAQLVAWNIIHGSAFAYSYGGERFDFSHPHFREIFFSARHGWFYWHPLLLVGVGVFLPWAWRRTEGRAWLVSIVAIVVLEAAWPTWWLGSSFGHRGFEVLTLFAMIGFASLLARTEKLRRLRVAFTAVASFAIAWNIALLALFLTHRIPREAPVTYRDSFGAIEQWALGPR